MLTTSFVDKQAYQEVIEDGHPILIVTASDIAHILRRNSITSSNIDEWLDSLQNKTREDIARRLKTYSEIRGNGTGFIMTRR